MSERPVPEAPQTHDGMARSSFERLVRRAAKRVLTDELRFRRVPFGVARGSILGTNLHRHLRIGLGLYELEIARYVRALVEPGATCFDVGAAAGYYTAALSRLSGSGSVVAFEPDPQEFYLLLEACRRNPGLEGRVTAIPKAVGAGPDDGTTSLDEFVASRPDLAPSFVKMDVEGNEYDVLRGAEETISAHHPRLVIETHGFAVEASCLQFLSVRGYAYLTVRPRRAWPETRPMEVNRWVVAVSLEDPRADVVLGRR